MFHGGAGVRVLTRGLAIVPQRGQRQTRKEDCREDLVHVFDCRCGRFEDCVSDSVSGRRGDWLSYGRGRQCTRIVRLSTLHAHRHSHASTVVCSTRLAYFMLYYYYYYYYLYVLWRILG